MQCHICKVEYSDTVLPLHQLRCNVGSQKNFEEMNVKELKEYAAENGIDLGSATKKGDILAVIKGGNEDE